ncbi:hypothetical protein EV361DRAFT_787248 [Lentinula raphanica]|nr:hypothetical protein EV361DRAFT_787248 [Lentinula raphanica]
MSCKEKNTKSVLRLTSETLTFEWHTPTRHPTRPCGDVKPRPCPGLTNADNPQIPVYLGRSVAAGGGSRPLTVISKDLFGKLFRDLTPSERELVLSMQYHESLWRNEHGSLCVFSTSCTHVSSGEEDGRALPCAYCLSLLKNKIFQKRIAQAVPTDENFKYTNKMFRNEVLGIHYINTKGLKRLVEAKVSLSLHLFDGPFLSFAIGAVEGKYDGNEVFLGLVKAMVQKVDRAERGVGMQNFRYAPAFDEFVHIVEIHSPRVHRFLSQHFPVRSRNSIRSVKSTILNVFVYSN